MSMISTAEAREHFSELVNRTCYGNERITLTRRGKQIAAIISIEDLALLEKLEDELDIKDAIAAMSEVKEKGTISLAELKKELKLE